MLSLRTVTPNDLELLASLLAEIDGETPASPYELQAVLAKIARYPDYLVYLAELGGEVVGTFSMLIFPTLAHGGRPEAVIEAVVISPTSRGRGIGRQMMQLAIAKARDAGCYKLALSSNAKRLDAHRFYRGMGFEQHGISFSIRCDEQR